jgi:malate dehydrogenase
MRCKVGIAGSGELAEEVATNLAQTDLFHVVEVGPADAPWDDAAGADVVVLAGHDPAEAARHAATRCPSAVVVVATEPVEAGCRDALIAGRSPRARVVGLAGEVESARVRAAAAGALGVSASEVNALVLGGRGATAVPVLSALRVAGLPVTDKLATERVAEVVAGLRDGEPASHREVAEVVAQVVEAIVFDRRRVMACAALCLGELGVERAVAGVPVVLGQGGIERILDVALDDREREALVASAVALD